MSQADELGFAGSLGAFRLNPALNGHACIRCGAEYAVGDYFEGCPACLGRGEPSSLRSIFDRLPDRIGDPSKRGMARYAAWMPYSSWLSLGEGGTSCIALSALAGEVGTAAIYLKNEGQNPSGSHKDRASCLTVTRALDAGAKRIVTASSGNGGASLALYAAAAGIECCVVSTPALSPIFRQAVAMTGARLITAQESLDRWRIVAQMTKEEGWFPATNYLNPPVGSNHFGVDGLKAVAYELVEDLGPTKLDVVIVPSSRGDLIWGLYEGFSQLRAAGLVTRIPRLFAVEPIPRIARVLEGAKLTGSFHGSTNLLSIGGSTVTYQAVDAVERSGGGAVVVDDEDVLRDQRRLARHGCYLESSSAAALTGAEQLVKSGLIGPGDAVALIATSHGYKELSHHEATA